MYQLIAQDTHTHKRTHTQTAHIAHAASLTSNTNVTLVPAVFLTEKRTMPGGTAP